jgi:hypothetical protein
LVAPSIVQQLLVKVTPFVTNMTLNINCLFAPTVPNWGFNIGTQGQYLYDASASGPSVDFELDISEKNNLIINILKYAGVIINDPTIIQVASQEAQQTSINEKS